MKKVTFILASSAFLVANAEAQEVSVSASVSYDSEYVFRGAQLAEGFIAPAVDVSIGNFYAGTWSALPIESGGSMKISESSLETDLDGDPDTDLAITVDSVYPSEVDFYTGFSMALNEAASIDIGATLYTYPEDLALSIDDQTGSDLGLTDQQIADVNDELAMFESDETLEVYAGVSLDVPISPSVYVFYDFDLETLTIEGSIGHSFELSESGAVDISGYLGHVDPDVGGSHTYYGAGVAYNYAVNDAVSFSLYTNWSGATEDLMFDGDDNQLWFGFSVSAGM